MQGGLFKFWSLKFENFQQILMKNESLSIVSLMVVEFHYLIKYARWAF